MELSARKKEVLSYIVRNYILSGEPIGSKSMCDAIGGISSATIRNEMSALENMQLLCHPHTSAGRVPTLSGYRYYIDNLMVPKKLTQKQKDTLCSLLPDNCSDKSQAIRFAASTLSQTTKCTVIVTDKIDSKTRVHKVELLPISASSVLIMLITSAGNVMSRTYRFPGILTERSVDAFLNLVNQQLVGEPICNMHPAALQTIVAQSGADALEVAPLVSELSELISEAGKSKLMLVGEANLLSCADYSVLKAKEIFSLLTRRDEVLNLLEIWDNDSGVILGGDTPYRALENSSIVVSKYSLGPMSGYIGVIGPTRMDYDLIIPSIEYFAKKLGETDSYARA